MKWERVSKDETLQGSTDKQKHRPVGDPTEQSGDEEQKTAASERQQINGLQAIPDMVQERILGEKAGNIGQQNFDAVHRGIQKIPESSELISFTSYLGVEKKAAHFLILLRWAVHGKLHIATLGLCS